MGDSIGLARDVASDLGGRPLHSGRPNSASSGRVGNRSACSQARGDLHQAAVRGRVAAARQLVDVYMESAMDRDNMGRLPLHLAALHGHVGVVEELLWAFPDGAQEKDDLGKTPLDYAQRAKHDEVVDRLMRVTPADPEYSFDDDAG